MAAQTNEVRRSNYFISQSPSDDEEFPYWTPADYLERKFAITNTQVWELIRSRQSVDTHTRNPALVSIFQTFKTASMIFAECAISFRF